MEAFIDRHQEVSLLAHTRYLVALAAFPDPAEPREVSRSVGQRVVVDGHSSRAFNPLDETDARRLVAIQ